jgi:hypothetical protein
LLENSISHIVVIDRETDKVLVNESSFSGRCVSWNSTTPELWRMELEDEVAFGYYAIIIYGENEVQTTQLEPARPELNCEIKRGFYPREYPRELGDWLIKYSYCEYKLFNDLKRRVINYSVTNAKTQTLKLCSNALSMFKIYESCGTPEKPLHSVVTTYGNYSHFECEVDYELSGNSIVRCGQQGKWLDSFPKCVPKTCRIPALNYSDPQIIIRYTNAFLSLIPKVWPRAAPERCCPARMAKSWARIRPFLYARVSMECGVECNRFVRVFNTGICFLTLNLMNISF